jgi:hypothetical protein
MKRLSTKGGVSGGGGKRAASALQAQRFGGAEVGRCPLQRGLLSVPFGQGLVGIQAIFQASLDQGVELGQIEMLVVESVRQFVCEREPLQWRWILSSDENQPFRAAVVESGDLADREVDRGLAKVRPGRDHPHRDPRPLAIKRLLYRELLFELVVHQIVHLFHRERLGCYGPLKGETAYLCHLSGDSFDIGRQLSLGRQGRYRSRGRSGAFAIRGGGRRDPVRPLTLRRSGAGSREKRQGCRSGSKSPLRPEASPGQDHRRGRMATAATVHSTAPPE